MAFAYIREYADIVQKANGGVQMGAEPAILDQAPVTIGAGANPSAAFNPLTRVIRINVDVVCSFLIGPAGSVATTNNARMAAGQTEYFGVRPGDIVSFIANT